MSMSLDIDKMLDKAASIADHVDAISSLDRDRQKLLESMQQECGDLQQMANILGVAVNNDNIVQFARLILTIGESKKSDNKKAPIVTSLSSLEQMDFMQEVLTTEE